MLGFSLNIINVQEYAVLVEICTDIDNPFSFLDIHVESNIISVLGSSYQTHVKRHKLISQPLFIVS